MDMIWEVLTDGEQTTATATLYSSKTTLDREFILQLLWIFLIMSAQLCAVMPERLQLFLTSSSQPGLNEE